MRLDRPLPETKASDVKLLRRSGLNLVYGRKVSVKTRATVYRTVSEDNNSFFATTRATRFLQTHVSRSLYWALKSTDFSVPY